MNDPRSDFPDLSGTEATRDTIHVYSRVLGALRRAHAPPHERWWHVSLRLGPRGPAMPPTPWPNRPDSSFSADIERYLSDEPVQACPPSAAYRFKKFSRRNKVVIGMVHLLPLPGTPFYEEGNVETALAKAVADATALEQGGADGCLIQTVDRIYPPTDDA